MVGAVPRNFHAASRSEILADYLLSGWGTVTPVRRQDDFGVDLYCTLTKDVGQRSIVSEYYSVQVKSNDAPWVFDSPDEIHWFFDHPTPLFLACVDRKATVLSIYQTIPRFLASYYDTPARLRLAADAYNGALRRVNILRFRMPDRYSVNEVPRTAGLVEQGRIKLTESQLAPAIRTLAEVVDCVGHQLHHDHQRELALLAAALLRRLRAIKDPALEADIKWARDATSPLEIDVAYLLNNALTADSQPTYVDHGLDSVLAVLRDFEPVRRYLSPAM